MGLFNFFKHKNGVEIPEEPIGVRQEIPKDLFVEDKDYIEVESDTATGIKAIYSFLLEDFELRGYNDALINPDESYKQDNLKLLAQDLDILIQKVDTFYQDRMRILNFHITSRSRAGLVDLVEELKTHQEIVKEIIWVKWKL